jgi:GTP-binding protein HflX
MNKIDCMAERAAGSEHDAQGRVQRVWLSARSGQGLELLRHAISAHLNQDKASRRIWLAPGAGRIRAQLFALGAVNEEAIVPSGGWELDVTLSDARWAQVFATVSAEEMRDVAPARSAG